MIKRDVVAQSKCHLPTPWANFTLYGFFDDENKKEHLALVLGEVLPEQETLVRIHSECLTGDAFFSLRCDCGAQLQKTIRMIAENGSGILLYLRQEGRGIGLLNKIKAYNLQDNGLDTVQANHALGFRDDQRCYDYAKLMLDYFGVKNLRLITNNPRKIAALNLLGFSVSRQEISVKPNPENKKYLETKKVKLGHLLMESKQCDCSVAF